VTPEHDVKDKNQLTAWQAAVETEVVQVEWNYGRTVTAMAGKRNDLAHVANVFPAGIHSLTVNLLESKPSSPTKI
jgi:hypothetical protein